MRALAAAVALLACGASAAPAPPVVLISIDSLRPDHLGAYGYAKPVSPSFDALARESTVFLNAFSVGTWTRPSHMALFTSVYPGRTGAESGSGRMSRDLVTLAQALAERGYATAGFASTQNLFPAFGFDRGFQVYEATNSWSDVWTAVRENQRKALDWTQAHRDRPFFLFFHYYTVHYAMDPKKPLYAAPPECLSALGGGKAGGPRASSIAMPRYEGGLLIDFQGRPDPQGAARLYDASILCTDRLLGGFLGELKKQGVYDQAIIVVLADHGDGLFDHGLLSHGTVYDDVLRVPLLIKLPDGRGAGRRVTAQARTIDVMPTILEAAGIPVPAALKEQMRGSSLLGLRDGPGRDVCASIEVENVWLHALRRPDGWKLVENGFLKTRALYDLRSDPGETRDVFARHPDIAGDLEQRLADCLDADR